MAKEQAGEPIFIFLPVREGGTTPTGVAIDPVCGRALHAGSVAGKLLHDGVHYEFCSLDCARAFATHPEEYQAA